MDGNFTLENDASDTGLRICLRQEGKPVAYLSHTLSSAEKNYGITEREVSVTLWAMENLQYYLIGKKFKLITDHKAIEFISTKLQFGSVRVQRWFYRFAGFNFEVEYIKGEELVVADALSRSHDGSVYLVQSNEKENEERKNAIINFHVKLNHRKKIKKDLMREGINDIISSC